MPPYKGCSPKGAKKSRGDVGRCVEAVHQVALSGVSDICQRQKLETERVVLYRESVGQEKIGSYLK